MPQFIISIFVGLCKVTICLMRLKSYNFSNLALGQLFFVLPALFSDNNR